MDHSSSSDPLPREELVGLAVGQTLVTAPRGITASAILDLGTGSGETARRVTWSVSSP